MGHRQTKYYQDLILALSNSGIRSSYGAEANAKFILTVADKLMEGMVN